MASEMIIAIIIPIILIILVLTLFGVEVNKENGILNFSDYDKGFKIFIMSGLFINIIFICIGFMLIFKHLNSILCELKIKEFMILFFIIVLSTLITLFILFLDNYLNQNE